MSAQVAEKLAQRLVTSTKIVTKEKPKIPTPTAPKPGLGQILQDSESSEFRILFSQQTGKVISRVQQVEELVDSAMQKLKLQDTLQEKLKQTLQIQESLDYEATRDQLRRLAEGIAAEARRRSRSIPTTKERKRQPDRPGYGQPVSTPADRRKPDTKPYNVYVPPIKHHIRENPEPVVPTLAEPPRETPPPTIPKEPPGTPPIPGCQDIERISQALGYPLTVCPVLRQGSANIIGKLLGYA